MKRRNAESGKMRRPLKRTKITEGMYGNSMVYLKFVMLWATVVLADYMLEFRFEFLWPFWMMLRSVYDSFKYQGLAFSVFFICIALTSDMICYFFIPLQYIFFAASTYVWVQYTWYTFADKGLCLPTVAVCCLVLWIEGALRIERVGVGVGVGVGAGLCRPLAAHALGYPAVTLGIGVKSYVGHRLRLRRQRRVRAENEFYFQLMRDALPEPAPDQTQPASQPPAKEAECEPKQMNGSVRRRCAKEQNGHCPQEHAQLQFKLDKLEKHLAAATASANSNTSAATHASANSARDKAHAHAHTNGAPHALHIDDAHTNGKGSVKSTKCEKKEANTLKEEKRKNKNKDKDKESSDSHKSTEQLKEKEQNIVKEVESTKESVKSKECNGYKEKEKDKEKEREREREQREARESKDAREARSLSEEVRRLKAEVASAVKGEAEARRALAACAVADRQRRQDHQQLKQAHAALQHKMSAWRCSERATASLERRLGEERRARTHVENQLMRQRHARQDSNGECENSWCASRRAAAESEASALRRDLQRARDHAHQLQRDLNQATEKVRTLEARQEENSSNGAARLHSAWAALQERAAHLERSLSAETRVKLDLLSALGDAKRHMHIQEGVISRQEKELEELKAQLLALVPRLPAPLDPNACVYTPNHVAEHA
ncbi:hypothetical protein ABMA28_004953 [Loxostege sticticalis]|uniref:Macoilin n=1 Tax=Loxostege sticticalis TaxID=481309 RepID=A0ABD0SNW7_LOXSC